MNKEFDSEPVYGGNDKYIKAKVKSYGDFQVLQILQIFKAKRYQKKIHQYKCLLLMMLDSAVRVNEKYYPQTLLEELKYEIKKNKMENFVNGHLDPRSSDNESDNDESDIESDNDKSKKLDSD